MRYNILSPLNPPFGRGDFDMAPPFLRGAGGIAPVVSHAFKNCYTTRGILGASHICKNAFFPITYYLLPITKKR